MRGQVPGSVHSTETLRSPVTVGSANPRMGNTGEMHSFVHVYNINSQRNGRVSEQTSAQNIGISPSLSGWILRDLT